MLLPTMTVSEVQKEVMNDFMIIYESSTLERLTFDYFNRRIKSKIKPVENYPVFFDIKSKAKNKWHILYTKNPERAGVYSPYEDISCYLITHYYTNKGLRAFLVTKDGILKVYNGHFFTRYKERLNLDIVQPLEVVKTFFLRNIEQMVKYYPPDADQKIYFMGLLKEGFAMGELQQHSPDIYWVVFKTFISNNTASRKHVDSELQLRYLLAKKLLAIQKDPKLPMTKELLLLSRQNGLIEKNEIVCDLNSIIESTPEHLKLNLNDDLYSF